MIRTSPRHVLAQRLLTSSPGATEHWARCGAFALSTAAASALGFVLGLGDRHPDNILVDLSTGEVVHIDYNVIFDAGLRLEVPERVPFRLTSCIQAALGPTHCDGRFRLAMERALAMLRARAS